MSMEEILKNRFDAYAGDNVTETCSKQFVKWCAKALCKQQDTLIKGE